MNLPPQVKTLATVICLCAISSSLCASDLEPQKPDTSDIYQKIILDRVTVVGAPVWKSSIPGAASYISAEQLQKQSYTDINRILRSVSGVNIQEEDGFGLRPNIGLRGTGSERSSKINIMEDGVLAAPAPYSAPAAYYFPNMARISSVEVRKGSSQIKYGPNTTGGAINLISTPIPAVLSGNAELSLGERNANKLYANFGNRTERFGYLFEVNQIGDNGFKELDNGGDTGFTVRDILGKFLVRTSPEASVYQRFELKVGYHQESSDETYLGLTREDFHNNPFRRYAASQVDQMDTEHFQLMGRHFVLFSDNVDLTTTLYRNKFSRAWYKLQGLNTDALAIETGNLSDIFSNPQNYQTELGILKGQNSSDDALTVRNNNRDYFSRGVESILGINFDAWNAKNQVELGVRFHQDEEDRFQFEDNYQMQDGIMVLTTGGLAGTQANRIGSAAALSVYLQDKIRTENWTFTPGLRYENIWFTNRNYGSNDLDRNGSSLNKTDYTVNVLVPGIGITYQATENISLISGIHRGFSPPSPGSSIETESEKSINYELGFRFADSVIQTELIGFYNNYSNLLGSDLAAGGGAGTTAQFNAGEVEVFGMEFTVNLDLADVFNMSSVSLPFNSNYTFTSATFQSSFESNFSPWGSVENGDEIPFIPRHQFSADQTVNYNDFSASLNVVYNPQMRTIAGSGSIEERFSTDSYVLLDVSSSYQANSNLRVFVNIRNVLNETYIVSDRPAGVRPGLPRTVMGGIKVSL